MQCPRIFHSLCSSRREGVLPKCRSATGPRSQRPERGPTCGNLANFHTRTRCERGPFALRLRFSHLGNTPSHGRLNMKQLSPEQREVVSSLARRLGAIPGIRAVVLGGSHARGRAQPGSDIDLGLLYSEAAPFSIQRVRELAGAVNDTAGPVVANFYE